MYIYKLRYPGTFLDFGDRDAAFRVFSLVKVIETSFLDAAVALSLFESTTVLEPRLPAQYEFRIPFINARTFLFSLDSLGKTVAVLSRHPAVPPTVGQVRERFYKVLPTLTGLRDSAHHIEDRARGMARGDKPIDLKPIVTTAINAPGGGVLASDILTNNRFGATMADGNFGEIEVSHETMEQVRSCVQDVLDALPWIGPAYECPSESRDCLTTG